MIYLVTGGSGSGKSEYAESLITASPFSNRIYLAAMEAYGEEGRRRVQRHRKLRQGKGFFTIERPRNLNGVLTAEQKGGAILLECLSNLAANQLFGPDGMVVTNEIFSDGIDYGPETGCYIRLLGRMNQWLAQRADMVVQVTAGIPVFFKGSSKGW